MAGSGKAANLTNAGKGRPRGVPNKVTKAFKTAVLDAFYELGGTQGLVKWGKRNPTEFYKIAARLIPHEVIGAGDNGEILVKTIQHVHEK